MATNDYTKTINGVKFNVHQDQYGTQNNEYYTSDNGMLSFQVRTDGKEMTTSGTAYGHDGIKILKRVFPNMETKNHMGASDDDGTPSDFPIVDFHKTSKY